MCCFTRPVKNVRSTRIFAREGEGKSQFIVYQMNLEAKEDLAMVLPLPVDQTKGEKALEFVNLEDYPTFFADLENGFIPPLGREIPMADVWSASLPEKLQVFEVGSFEASFVPGLKDFARLDERFRLPERAWSQLPEHRRFGFAVFKLKKGAHKYHPMALSFQRADANKLFFPTIHIHDGKFHLLADFDHALYCQPRIRPLNVLKWAESRGHAESFVDTSKSKGIVEPKEHCYKKELKGKLANRDLYLEKIA